MFLWPTLSSVQCVPVVLFPRVKSPAREAEISSQYSIAMRNESSYTSNPPYSLTLTTGTFIFILFSKRSWDRVVGLTARLRAGRSRVRTPAAVDVFLLSERSKPSLKPTRPLFVEYRVHSWGLGTGAWC